MDYYDYDCLGEVSHGKVRKTEITSSIFSKHNTMRLEMSNKEKSWKTNMWRLNHMLINSQWITEEIKEEIEKYLETNESRTMMIQNPLDVAKAVLRGKFIAIQFYLRKQEKSQINNLTLYLKQLWRKVWSCLKKPKIELPLWPSNSTPVRIYR